MSKCKEQFVFFCLKKFENLWFSELTLMSKSDVYKKFKKKEVSLE